MKRQTSAQLLARAIAGLEAHLHDCGDPELNVALDCIARVWGRLTNGANVRARPRKVS